MSKRNRFITYCAFVTISAQFIFLINLFWSIFKGPKASDNPWEATTLEWTTATPPPHDNFATAPAVGDPYDFSNLRYDATIDGYVNK